MDPAGARDRLSAAAAAVRWEPVSRRTPVLDGRSARARATGVRAALDSAIHDFLFALQEESDSGGALRVRVRGKDVAPASALTANRRTSPSACERAVSRD